MGSNNYLGGSSVINTGNSKYCRSDFLEKSKTKSNSAHKKKKRLAQRIEKGRIKALRHELLQKIYREEGQWDVKYLTNEQKGALGKEIKIKGGIKEWFNYYKNNTSVFNKTIKP